MTNLGAVAILTVARSSLQHCAGSGMPLPYSGRCSSAVPPRDCTPRALPRASRSGRHVGLRPPRNDKSGGHPRFIDGPLITPVQRREGTARPLQGACGRRGRSVFLGCAWRSLSAATDAIGACRFNGTLFQSFVQRRERHAAPYRARAVGGHAPPLPIYHKMTARRGYRRAVVVYRSRKNSRVCSALCRIAARSSSRLSNFCSGRRNV